MAVLIKKTCDLGQFAKHKLLKTKCEAVVSILKELWGRNEGIVWFVLNCLPAATHHVLLKIFISCSYIIFKLKK